MKPFPIPLVALGPGSQEDDEVLDYLAMPADMEVYHPPSLPESETLTQAPGALAVLHTLVARLAEGAPAEIVLSGMSEADLAVLNTLLAEGEVSARVPLAGGREVRVQESVFSGVWRLITTEGERVVDDRIEIGPVPQRFYEAAQMGWAAPAGDWDGPLPPGVVNAPALIAEIRSQAAAWRPGDAPHVVNLSLLPMSPEDIAFLDHHLGTGPLAVLSRGYGNCRVLATCLAPVWRVVYYNSADRVILNSVEICAMPEAAQAAPEDIKDSHERLADILTLLADDEHV